MIYDYYELDQYVKLSDDFFNVVKNYGKTNTFNDIYLSYLKMLQDIKERFSIDYEIDTDAYLFYLVWLYNLKNPVQKRKLLKHPYINSIIKDNQIIYFNTVFGNVKFKKWINGIPDIFKSSFNNLEFAPFKDSFKLFWKEYSGEFYGKCHEGSIQFCGNNDIVTAFVHEPQSGISFLHSFVENEERVLETTANFVMDKDQYYRLTKPEIITRLVGNELIDFYNEYSKKYPKLKNISIKQLLTNYDEIKRNPEKVKVKTKK